MMVDPQDRERNKVIRSGEKRKEKEKYGAIITKVKANRK
jgi:hypothetical protein